HSRNCRGRSADQHFLHRIAERHRSGRHDHITPGHPVRRIPCRRVCSSQQHRLHRCQLTRQGGQHAASHCGSPRTN
ncbi:hypothetical protein BN1723_020612, partial [Verticillium longisporum]